MPLNAATTLLTAFTIAFAIVCPYFCVIDAQQLEQDNAGNEGETKPVTYYDVLVQGTTLHHEGRVEEASKVYYAVMEAIPSYSDAVHLYGISLLDLGRRDEALVYAAKAVEMSPDDANFRNSYGEVLRRNGTAADVALAAEQFQISFRLNPSASVANNLGTNHAPTYSLVL